MTSSGRIGVVGVGGVARYAHLPSYREHGLCVTAICDVDAVTATAVAAEFGASAVAADVHALVARTDVDVVDIATPPATHVELIRAAARAGRPMLVQKPLCTSAVELAEIRRIRDEYGARIRLNLTGRYVSAWRKVSDLLAAGAIGRPFLCTVRNRDWWDREPGRWDNDIDDYIVYEMLIHHLDLCRFWFGPPRRVVARAGANPAQRLQQSNWVAAMVEYDAPQLVQFLEDWTMPEYGFATGHPFEEILVTGEAGVIRATSERVELSVAEGNRVQVWHLGRPGQVLPGEQLGVGWFPGSFGAAMTAYLDALARGVDAERDWAHAVALTEDTLTVAAALSTDRWLTCGPVA